MVKIKSLFFRPERRKYILEKKKQAHCVFCEALGKGVGKETLLIFKSTASMVFLNKYPYNSGHLLVLPQKHIGRLTDLSEEDYGDLSRTIRVALKALEGSYQCESLNLGLNQGKIAGAGIPEHLHYHLIPRWQGDTNFFPLIASSKVLIENLEQSYDRLNPYFNS